MKILYCLAAIAVLCPVLAFSLSNGQTATVSLWPFVGGIEMPLFVVCLVPFFVGLILGASIAWIMSIPLRLRLRRAQKQLSISHQKREIILTSDQPNAKQVEQSKSFLRRKS